MSDTTSEIEFEPLSPGFARDPYAVYARLRVREEPYFFAQQNMLLLSRYDDVAAVAANPSNVRSLEGYADDAELKRVQREANFHDMPYHERFVQFSLLDSDGELHRRLRKQVFGAFQTRSLSAMEPEIRSFVKRLTDKVAGMGQFDFLADHAVHIPGYVIGTFLGVPEEDCPQLRQWSEDVVRYFDVDRTDAKKQKAEQSTRDFHDYLVELKNERIRAPKDDLISKMIAEEQSGAYSPDEFISTCMLILMAGHGSTIDILGSGMHTLLKHPKALASLSNAPDALPVAIQEMFRYEPPLPFFHRHATEDVEVGGRVYPAGTTFGLLYASANRDETAFAEADTFDISRSPNRHLSFGIGAHLCLGNNLARINMRIIFETLFDTFKNFELLDEDVIYKPGLSVRGPEALRVSFR